MQMHHEHIEYVDGISNDLHVGERSTDPIFKVYTFSTVPCDRWISRTAPEAFTVARCARALSKWALHKISREKT